MAYKHDEKSSGQLIRSADWNTMGHEIERLETDKVNRAGDTIKGDLTVTGKAQLGSLAVTGDASTTGKVQFGPLTVSGDASVSGKAQLGSLAVTGDANVGGRLGIGAMTALGGKLEILTSGAGSWNKFVVNTTNQWGDGDTQYVTIGAGGAAGIMLHNPHVVWHGAEPRASIRMGRSDGKPSGAWWDIGVRSGNTFSILRDNGTNGLFISGDGQLTLGAKTSYWDHNPYADAIGPPVASVGRLEVGGFNDGSGKVPAVLRIHQWGSGSAEFYKPQGATLYLRETVGGGGGWFNTLEVIGAIRAGNSDLYFSKTDHNHTGIGNTDGWAAIENAKNFDALMILGRAHAGGKRIVKLWDYLEVNGDSVVNGMFFVNSPSGNRLIMQGDGNLVIYRSNGAAWWNSGTNVSDSRLKKDIRFIERPLEKLLSVTGISFSWAEEELGSERELGVLADEVEKVFPELVYSLDKKYKSVKYQGLIAVLIEAIKEQQATILRFGEEIQNLKGTLKPNPA